MIEYKEYLDKVEDFLASQGIGRGTIAYKNTNKDSIAQSFIMIDLIKTLKGIKNKDIVTETIEENIVEEKIEEKEDVSPKNKANNKKK